MKNSVVISDAGPIFSLTILNRLKLLDEFFEEIHIPNAVWEEISKDKKSIVYDLVYSYFESRITKIKGSNHLTFVCT